MEQKLPAYEGNLIYDFEEMDPRYCVEFLTPCPNLSPNTAVYFDGFFWNECGIVFQYNDGDNFNPRSFTLKVVFPCTIKSMRMFAMTVHQENKLFDLQHRSAAANLPQPIFHFYRCKYSNYYNWCMQQGFFEGETDFFTMSLPPRTHGSIFSLRNRPEFSASILENIWATRIWIKVIFLTPFTNIRKKNKR